MSDLVLRIKYLNPALTVCFLLLFFLICFQSILNCFKKKETKNKTKNNLWISFHLIMALIFYMLLNVVSASSVNFLAISAFLFINRQLFWLSTSVLYQIIYVWLQLPLSFWAKRLLHLSKDAMSGVSPSITVT